MLDIGSIDHGQGQCHSVWKCFQSLFVSNPKVVVPGSYLRKGYLAILWIEEFQEVLADLRIHSRPSNDICEIFGKDLPNIKAVYYLCQE